MVSKPFKNYLDILKDARELVAVRPDGKIGTVCITTENNGEFIAASREALPKLIELLEMAEGALRSGNYTYLGAEQVLCLKPYVAEEALQEIASFRKMGGEE